MLSQEKHEGESPTQKPISFMIC